MNLDKYLIFALLEWRVGEEVTGGIAPPKLDDWTRDQICYHAEILHERGWLQSYRHTLSDDGAIPRRLECRIGALTNAGHDALEGMRAARR